MYSVDQLKRIYTPEETLMILLCRLFFDTATSEDVRDFMQRSDIDPERFYELVTAHGLRPLIYTVVVQRSIQADQGLLDKLKWHFNKNQLQGFEKLSVIKNLTAALKAEGIHPIPIKGVLLGAYYYGDASARESSDIDFLISSSDVEKVEQQLGQQGFEKKLSVPTRYMNYYKRHFKEVEYVVPSSQKRRGYTLEMHWRLINKYMGNLPGHDFFQGHTIAFYVNHLEFEKLEPAYDFLAVASNHFVKDLSVKFKYLVDIAAMIRKDGSRMDVAWLQQVFRQFHCTKRVTLGLSMVEKLLGIGFENWKVNTQFQERFFKDVVRVPPVMNMFVASDIGFIKRSLRLQDSGTQRLSFLWRCLSYSLLPTDNDLHAFNGMPTPLIFILRYFRIAGKKLRKTIGG